LSPETQILSVRKLVEFTLRSGDLEFGVFNTKLSAVDAIKLHQKIQKSRPENYKSEVSISHTVTIDSTPVTLQGRIDGVFETEKGIIIDEIKTTHKSITELLKQNNQLHWGQGKCYAYLWSQKYSVEYLTVQLTYYNPLLKERKEVQKEYSKDELRLFTENLLQSYISWNKILEEWKRTLLLSCKECNFPFTSYRAGQREMAAAVYRTISAKNQALIEAPTGIGKSISTIFPAIKAIGEKKIDKIFYLSARTTGKEAAETALAALRKNNLTIKSLVLTAKKKICFNPEKSCTPDECMFARGHYDRINQALRESINIDAHNADSIREIAEKYTVCPFELSLDLALFVDCIICDYNYIFDPSVYLRRFFEDTEQTRYCFLVDEAHNLLDRSREMFSASITSETIQTIRKKVRKIAPGMYSAMGKLIQELKRYQQKNTQADQKNVVLYESPTPIASSVLKLRASIERWLMKNIKTSFRMELIEFFVSLGSYSRVDEIFDENYVTFCESTENFFTVTLYCINPAQQLGQAYEKGESTILFSATLSPLSYYHSILGCKKSAVSKTFQSPFSPDNLYLGIITDISTYFKEREHTALDIAQIIYSAINNTKGNILCFFPSYAYLQLIQNIFSIHYPNYPITVQDSAFTENERTIFLKNFTHRGTAKVLGFAVLGGAFSEGIDLIGDTLTGVIVITVGLPALSVKNNEIKKFFDSHGADGFKFAYMYTGFTRVLQAAGRVIRSENDRGFVLLIDKRFSQHTYTSVYPHHWKPHYLNKNQIARQLQIFWKDQEHISDTNTL